MASAAAPSSSQRHYDIFLSFRGEDTRNNFTAHLYHALRQKGINTFIDDDKLERGQVISPALVTAIENSMFSIVVLSKNYASSRWCLDELVKIVECMRSGGQRVFPIFYNVDPSDVRRQRGIFGEELAKHQENSENMERVQSWKDALTQVANLSGWDSRNKNEPLLIKEIVTDILNKLLSRSVSDTENLVGIDARIQEIEMLLYLESDDPIMVGIWGMGGIGKTTLAKAVYKKITSQFEASSFYENVGEDLANKGLIRLQQKFLSQLLEEPNLNMKVLTSIKERLHSKKVLIVLDNVNDPIILKSLIGNRDWFGQGSRIIVTTRDKRLLISHGVLNYYEAQRFSDGEAFKFLSHYSLKHKLLRDDFTELSKEVIAYAQGIPLALEVLGCFLFSMTKEEWRNQLDKLKSTPNMKIQEVLKVSYDGLDDKEKNIFLDIACFFKGEDKDYVMEILDGCGFFSLSGIRALIDKSLITISSNDQLMMHDLIQEMGREIVRQQSLEDPGKRSRLWFHEDIYNVLKKNTANEKIEGIFLNLSHLEEMLDFTTQAFSGMNKLRLLKVYKSKNTSRNFKDTPNKKNCKVNFSKDFKFCYDGLRSLYLYGYSFKSLPSDFNPKNLVELSMPYSHIKQLWKGIRVLKNLKFMDLSHSKYLIETPNFSGVTNLKRLVLKGCVSLHKVHSSLGDLKNLNFLNFKNCKMLKSLPSSSCDLKSLEILILSGCSKFEEFPENIGSLEMLTELYADEIALRVLPSSFSFLRNLKILSFKGCKEQPSTLPRSSNSIGSILQPLSGLCSLTNLNLSDCNLSDETNLSSLGFLSSMKWLYLSGNDFVALPSTISQLSNLQTLELSNCRRLQVLPELPSSIYAINAENCTSLNDVSLLATSKWQVRKFMDLFGYPSVKPGESFVALKAIIPASRIPNWIRYQSSGSEVKAELHPNWFNSNFLGFALSFVIFEMYCSWIFFQADISFDWTSSDDSSSIDITTGDLILFNGRLESDHMCLFYVPPPQLSNCSQVTGIKVSFKINYMQFPVEIKRCGVGLLYSNEDGNHNNPPMIQFDSISSPPPPPPNKSAVVLEEIHGGEPSGNGCSNVDGSEVENCEYHSTADEEERIALKATREKKRSQGTLRQNRSRTVIGGASQTKFRAKRPILSSSSESEFSTSESMDQEEEAPSPLRIARGKVMDPGLPPGIVPDLAPSKDQLPMEVDKILLQYPSFSSQDPPITDVGVLFPPTERMEVEVPDGPEMNFTANIPAGTSLRTAQSIAAIRGLDDDQITEMGVAMFCDLNRRRLLLASKLEAANKLRAYAAQAREKEKEMQATLELMQQERKKFEKENKSLHASVRALRAERESLKTENEQLLSSQQKYIAELSQVRTELEQTKVAMEAQKQELTTDHSKQVSGAIQSPVAEDNVIVELRVEGESGQAAQETNLAPEAASESGPILAPTSDDADKTSVEIVNV